MKSLVRLHRNVRGAAHSAYSWTPHIGYYALQRILPGSFLASAEAVEQGLPPAPVLADAGYGNETRFREEITELGLPYAVGIQGTTTVWPPGETPRPKKRRKGRGRPPTRLPQETDQRPLTVKDLALALPGQAWKTVTWRPGTKHKLRSRFAAVRVRPAHRDPHRTEPYPEQWLLMEWPPGETEPAKYWLSTLPAHTKLTALVRVVKHRWIIERDYEELKQEVGMGHYEGRGWRGFHHHATLCIAAYGFLVIERTRFSPSAHSGRLDLRAAKLPAHLQPRRPTYARRAA